MRQQVIEFDHSPRINFLEKLPPEIIPRVLLNLDSFSLRSLLRAFPVIARNCILLFEEWMSDDYDPCKVELSEFGCFFYECHDLRKLPLSQYNPQVHKSYFKIYEAATQVSFKGPKMNMKPQDRFPFINRHDSLVHIYFHRIRRDDNTRTDNMDWGPGYNPQEHKLSVSLLKGGYAFHAIPILQMEKEFYRLPITNSFLSIGTTCAAIRLEGIEKIESLTLPPSVKSLTVVFNKSHKNPVIRNLVFTSDELASCKSLMIYYHDRVPLIEGLSMPLLIPFYAGNPGFLSICNKFLLAHIPSLAGNLTTALPPHPDETRDFSCLTKALSGMCSSITIIGGPNGLFSCLDLSTDAISSLHFKQTCQYLSPEHRLLELTGVLRGLYKFRFETVLENPVVPALVATSDNLYLSDDVSLSEIYITSRHGIDLSRFTSRLKPQVYDLWYMFIDVTCNCSTDYVSSAEALLRILVDCPRLNIRGLEIVGLRKSDNVIESLEAFERRIRESISPYYRCTISLID